MAFGVETGEFGLVLVDKIDQHLDLTGGRIGGGIDPPYFANEFLLAVAIDAKAHRLAGFDVTDFVGRDQAFKTHAGRVDHFEQFLADLRGIARRHLAVADNAIKWRARLGALQLLSRQHGAGLGGGKVALRRIATNVSVFKCLHRGHPRTAQGRHALKLPLGLHKGLICRPGRCVGRGQAVANGGIVETHQQVTAPDGVTIFFHHLQHHRRHLGTQIRAALGLHGAGNRRARCEGVVTHGVQVFRRNQQRLRVCGSSLPVGIFRCFATRGEG